MTDFLLDTHVFLWWQTGDKRLGREARKIIAEPSNRIFVSAASVWEIALKARKGKLSTGASPAASIAANGFHELPIHATDAEQAAALDWAHPDPFDRMLIAQAVARSLVLVSADEEIRKFGGVAQLRA
jgi:PIN domain nuclease of toxin-antitoxin system